MPAHDFKSIRPNIFHDFHNTWIAFIKGALNNGILPRDYYALSEQAQNDVRPDVVALELNVSESPAEYGSVKSTITETKAPPKTEFTARTDGYFYGARRRTLAIRHVDGHHLVAFFELLSKSNKSSPDQLQKLISKATDALSNGIHVSIVDPFQPNKHSPFGIHGSLWQAVGEEVHRGL